jgi:hypothetical protein
MRKLIRLTITAVTTVFWSRCLPTAAQAGLTATTID